MDYLRHEPVHACHVALAVELHTCPWCSTLLSPTPCKLALPGQAQDTALPCRLTLCAQAPHSPLSCRTACEHRLSTGCRTAYLLCKLKLGAGQRPAAVPSLKLSRLACTADLRFEDAMASLERCSTSMFQPMELFPLFPEATSPWRAHLPVKPFWGLHPPLTDLPALVRRGLRRQHRLNGASRSSSEAGSSSQDGANRSEEGRSQQVWPFQCCPSAIRMVSVCSPRVVTRGQDILCRPNLNFELTVVCLLRYAQPAADAYRKLGKGSACTCHVIAAGLAAPAGFCDSSAGDSSAGDSCLHALCAAAL